MNPLDLIVTIIRLIADLPKSIRRCPNLFLAIQSPDVKGVNIGRKRRLFTSLLAVGRRFRQRMPVMLNLHIGHRCN